MAETYRIGLDVGGTKVLGAIFDGERNIVHRLKKKSTEQGAEAEHAAMEQAAAIIQSRLTTQPVELPEGTYDPND